MQKDLKQYYQGQQVTESWGKSITTNTVGTTSNTEKLLQDILNRLVALENKVGK